MLSSFLIKFLLTSLPCFTFYSPAILSQFLPPYPGRQGEWQLLQASIGISAMHMQVLHNNKVVIFDRTEFGHSNITLSGGRCLNQPRSPLNPAGPTDCTAHSVLYDISTNTFRTLMIQTDTWCSSGAVLPNGTLIQTGGYNNGDRVVRTFTPCENENCDWNELGVQLSRRRWYSSTHILPDGRIIIVGGRRVFNYEFFPSSSQPRPFHLRLLAATRDGNFENNLYPFLHLLPDGNLFIFANTRSILLNYNLRRVMREFPSIPGGNPRNYPSSGSSVLLPLDENRETIEAEILICGGAPRNSFPQTARRIFVPASSTCGRLMVSARDPDWVMETMPIPRVMGDMLILPTGDIIIINGGGAGTAGWEAGRDEVLRPVIYRPFEQSDWRFAVMAPASRPRMYHSSAVLLPDARVLVGGSNPHENYVFYDVLYPTELSLEAFKPPYFSDEYDRVRPRIGSANSELLLRHGEEFSVGFSVAEYLSAEEVTARMVAPSFTTHSFAMNQRMVVLKMAGIERDYGTSDGYTLRCVGPSTAFIAPPGYYMLFVVHAGIPSSAVWVRLS